MKKKLKEINNIHNQIIANFKLCNNSNKYLWGVQAHKNAFWMKNEAVCGLYFCVGVFHGYINRHDEDLKLSEEIEVKEDYENIIFDIFFYIHRPIFPSLKFVLYYNSFNI